MSDELKIETKKEEDISTQIPSHPPVPSNLQPASKKIKKSQLYPSKSKASKSKKGSPSQSKYETFDQEEKQMILSEIYQGLLQSKAIKIKEEDNFFADELLRIVKSIELKVYNQVIITVLQKYVPGFDPDSPVRVLSQWRKKIKSWAKNCGKPENRGNPVVPLDHASLFHQELLRILETLKSRQFGELRVKVLTVVEEFTAKGFYGKKANVKKTCSKHWWFDFLKRNADIRERWEKLPVKRGPEKRIGIPRRQKPPAPNHPLHMPDPIFCGEGSGLGGNMTVQYSVIPEKAVKDEEMTDIKDEFRIEIGSCIEKLAEESELVKNETQSEFKEEDDENMKSGLGNPRSEDSSTKYDDYSVKMEETPAN